MMKQWMNLDRRIHHLSSAHRLVMWRPPPEILKRMIEIYDEKLGVWDNEVDADEKRVEYRDFIEEKKEDVDSENEIRLESEEDV